KYLLDTRDGVDRCINITQPNFVHRYIQHKLWHGNHRIGARSCIKTKSRKTDWTTGNQPVEQVRHLCSRKLRPSSPCLAETFCNIGDGPVALPDAQLSETVA